ncbi:Cytochrome b5 [Nakaseomyces glabratus]|uniref:Cytochrome b5 n=1 Tax=Candida glabrata TaxID=5478 RepID=A0A0W0CZ33_CANGB|nr:Cytochrome b5 family, heme-binding domain profile [Nakaseomyces glabratus]KAH7594993.1 Cytochrome b5 family, heme-binding domain profile [Nakaseomyces glabratus]KAH7611076.1 Cytochrome b5 family, heme-binding domain profile [Nakaseomyces glabratus]KTB01186.1 Cytochrome b5 [Nakaseomyces glabratus]KTB04850.1 Cytochrome b5 [Nakaseomyces glabratus]
MSEVYTYKQVSEHNKEGDCWIIIDGSVYDVSKFLDEHPGGDEIIFEHRGTDATGDFVDIGHSDDALKILKTLKIGEVDPNSERVVIDNRESDMVQKSTEGGGKLVIVLGLLALAVAYYTLN